MTQNIYTFSQSVINLFDEDGVQLSFDEHDHYAHMVTFFYYKQRNHMISVMKLSTSYDARLICRCMIEGLLQLTHAKSDRSVAEKWMLSSNIENLKILAIKEQSGIEVDPNTKQKILDYLKHSGELLKERSRKDIEQTGRQPEYRDYDRPLKTSIADLAKTLEETGQNSEEMYLFYDDFTNWQHWKVLGFNEFMDYSDNRLSLNEVDSRSMLVTIWAILCLLKTSEIFNDKFELNKEKEISDLYETLVSLFPVTDNDIEQ